MLAFNYTKLIEYRSINSVIFCAYVRKKVDVLNAKPFLKESEHGVNAVMQHIKESLYMLQVPLLHASRAVAAQCDKLV